jgi:hypothetical protein
MTNPKPSKVLMQQALKTEQMTLRLVAQYINGSTDATFVIEALRNNAMGEPYWCELIGKESYPYFPIAVGTYLLGKQ